MDYSKEIIYYRALHGLSQREFAKLSNLTLQTIYNIENGKRNLTKLTKAKIEIALKKD